AGRGVHVEVLDHSTKISFKVEIQGSIDADGVCVRRPGISADEVWQIGFADGNFAKGEEIFFSDSESEFEHAGAKSVSENNVGDFEGIDSKAVTIEFCNGVLIGANQRVLHDGVLADHLFERFEVAESARGISRLSLPTESLVRLQLDRPYCGVRR